MLITKLKSKIHRCVVTGTNLDYEGSCAIGEELMFHAGIEPYEQIHIYNINNGERFVTYAILGEEGEIDLRGSAARKGVIGDELIICTYCLVSVIDEEHQPVTVYVTGHNRAYRMK